MYVFIHSFIADIYIAPLQVELLRSAPNLSAVTSQNFHTGCRWKVSELLVHLCLWMCIIWYVFVVKCVHNT